MLASVQMRWSGRERESEEASRPPPALGRLSMLVRSVTTPQFVGIRY